MDRRDWTDPAGTAGTAWFSDCGRYRYGLRRVWDAARPQVLFVMLNPSTATEMRDDATIARCRRRAAALGFGGLRVANLFAWRATDPAAMKAASDPVGPENDAALHDLSADVALTVAAWGAHGAWKDRGPQVAACLSGPVAHLGLTRAGHPRHPLFVALAVAPQPWPPHRRYV